MPAGEGGARRRVLPGCRRAARARLALCDDRRADDAVRDAVPGATALRPGGHSYASGANVSELRGFAVAACSADSRRSTRSNAAAVIVSMAAAQGVLLWRASGERRGDSGVVGAAGRLRSPPRAPSVSSGATPYTVLDAATFTRPTCATTLRTSARHIRCRRRPGLVRAPDAVAALWMRRARVRCRHRQD